MAPETRGRLLRSREPIAGSAPSYDDTRGAEPPAPGAAGGGSAGQVYRLGCRNQTAPGPFRRPWP